MGPLYITCMYQYHALCFALLFFSCFYHFSSSSPFWAQPAWSRCPLFPILRDCKHKRQGWQLPSKLHAPRRPVRQASGGEAYGVAVLATADFPEALLEWPGGLCGGPVRCMWVTMADASGLSLYSMDLVWWVICRCKRTLGRLDLSAHVLAAFMLVLFMMT